MKYRYIAPLLFTTLSLGGALTLEEQLDTIDQKGAREEALISYNSALPELKERLEERYSSAALLAECDADPSAYRDLLDEVRAIQSDIAALQEAWRSEITLEEEKRDTTFGMWDARDVTVGQLIMEYGSNDYLYVIPPAIHGMKLHLYSALPIPRASWSDLLEIVLASNGIGVKQLNEYARSLYVMKQDMGAPTIVVDDEASLGRFGPEERLIYIFSPPPERMKGVAQFFERFKTPKEATLYQVGYKLALTASRREIDKLLSLYKAVWSSSEKKTTKVVSVGKLGVEEMERILSSYFSQSSPVGKAALSRGDGDDLTIMKLPQEGALALIGPQPLVERAETIIAETESQLLDPSEMTVFTYTCRHTDPTELCDVLETLYTSLTTTTSLPRPTEGESLSQGSGGKHFIPYPKSGSIMMVVQRDRLEAIQQMVRRLDIPKKMVNIEVLLFEKKVSNKHHIGMNLLKLGTDTARKERSLLSFSDPNVGKGIFQFLLSKNGTRHLPGFDIAYNFLMSQEGVSINASPSVTTLNQTPGQIKLVEELSISEGLVQVGKGNRYEKKYTRSQYGTIISITPTIHEPEYGLKDPSRFVTLDTDITFETINADVDDKPKVIRRHVENQVRIRDGETLILGGLKRKMGEHGSEKIPFLGEIPGIGKLFGSNKRASEETEMFIFITPKVIVDDEEIFAAMRREELMKRPGDLPEFLVRAREAKSDAMPLLFANSLDLVRSSEEYHGFE